MRWLAVTDGREGIIGDLSASARCPCDKGKKGATTEMSAVAPFFHGGRALRYHDDREVPADVDPYAAITELPVGA